VGVRFRELQADPFAGVRWRHTEPLGTWVLNTTERLRAYADAGPESRTTVDWNHILIERLLFRSATRGIWRDQEPGFEYGERFTFFQTLDSRTVLAYDWDTSFDTETVQAVTETVVSVRLSRRVSRNQVLLEIAPQIAWRQDIDYEPALGLFVRIEMSFGRE
jgi:hypothetical protein